MWEAIKVWLQSPETWNAMFFLVGGVIGGAIVSVWYSINAHRPKLIVSGGGSGGNQNGQTWGISISNRPSFFGSNLDGDVARDVFALIRLNEPKSQSYWVFWENQQDVRTTIEPGQQQSIKLFHWKTGTKGYSIVDKDGDPVANFQDRERNFILTLRDRFERITEFRFVVEFDDTHLKNPPKLQIVQPISMSMRLYIARDGIRAFLSAFRMR